MSIIFIAIQQKLIIDLKGRTFLYAICYHLRFPVWLRNTAQDSYDLLLVIANWPKKRSLHWRTLIESKKRVLKWQFIFLLSKEVSKFKSSST
jgi:predicted amidohydrolase